jgi:cation diffusion facilitator CzcD-associated flavoprotein CzcO
VSAEVAGPSPAPERCRVLVVGAGFGGLALAHALAERGVDDVVLLERDDGVGGTWRANTYPGAACDVPSHLYSLSFAPNPNWSRTYASQPEILEYVEGCYDRLDVRRKVRTSTTVTAARWQDADRLWLVQDDRGGRYEAEVLVSAVGLFHSPVVPDVAGRSRFSGPQFHSARWDHSVDLAGRSVAVVGTGASAIQVVPAIAERVGRLAVFQRTPAWIVPRRDVPYTDDERRRFAEDPEEARLHRQAIADLFEQNTSFMTDDPTTPALAAYARDYLAHKVPDPALRARLTPDYPIGCKRVLVSSDFYPTVQRDDVELVTDRIAEVTPAGIRTEDGTERPVDVIVWCTGFRATEYLRGIEVTGCGGADLHATWAGVPRAFLGMAVRGFPNLFLLYGPNTNQGGNSILLMLEAQAGYVAEAVATMARLGVAAVDVRAGAMARYSTELDESLAATVWNGGCDSYFRTASGDIVTQIPHTAGWYRDRTAGFDPDDYELRPRRRHR